MKPRLRTSSRLSLRRHHDLLGVADLRRGWRRGGRRRGRLVGGLRHRRQRALVPARPGAGPRQPDRRHAGAARQGRQGQPGRQSRRRHQR